MGNAEGSTEENTEENTEESTEENMAENVEESMEENTGENREGNMEHCILLPEQTEKDKNFAWDWQKLLAYLRGQAKEADAHAVG